MAREFGICGEIVITSDGGFASRFLSTYQNIAPGSSGDLVIITPPAGQKVRLVSFNTGSTTTIQAGITIDVGGVELVTNKTVGGGNSVNEFMVGFGDADSNGNVSARYPHIEGKVDEIMTITKVSGSTTTILYYAYEFGE